MDYPAGFLFLWLVLCARTAGGSPETTAPTDATPPKSAQTVNDLAPKQFLKGIWTDQKAMWTSPFHERSPVGQPIALPLAAGTAALIATDQDAANWLPNTPDQVKWSKRVSNIGAAYTLGGMVGGSLLVGWKSHDSQISEIGRTSARALVDSVIISYALKFATARERPTENDGQGRFWKGSNSFPSAHAMDSWAVAMVVARSSKSPTWLKVTSCTLATVVSLSRWGLETLPSDIFVGGVLGGLIGNYVATHPQSSSLLIGHL
jgi:hypothetical protein